MFHLIKKTDAKKSILSEKAALHHRTCLGDKKIFISTFLSCLTLSLLTDGIYTASHLITKMECEDENALKSFPQGHHIYKLSFSSLPGTFKISHKLGFLFHYPWPES